MDEQAYLLIIALTVFLSWLLTGAATWYASRAGLLDHPGERHSHCLPTPRGGGAGLVLALVLVTTVAAPALAPAYWVHCTLMAVWWMSEAMPLSATALLPIVLLPALTGLTIDDATMPYADPIVFLFLGGFLIAIASQPPAQPMPARQASR